MKEASDLGNVCAFINYPFALSSYADELKENSENSTKIINLYEQALASIDASISKIVTVNITKEQIELLENLRSLRRGHSLSVAEYLFRGIEKTEENLIRALRILKESINPDLNMNMYKGSVDIYMDILETISTSYANGTNGFEQNPEKAATFFCELNEFGAAYQEWKMGLDEALKENPDYDKAIEHFNTSYDKGLTASKENLLRVEFDKAKNYLGKTLSVAEENGIESEVTFQHLKTTYDLMDDVYNKVNQDKRFYLLEDVKVEFLRVINNMMHYYEEMSKLQIPDSLEIILHCLERLRYEHRLCEVTEDTVKLKYVSSRFKEFNKLLNEINMK